MDGKLNIDDANLPTTGKVWDAMLKHVMANCDVDDIIEEIQNRGNDIPLADLLDADCGDDQVVEYVHDAGIPIDAIYDEDDLPAKWTQPIFNKGFLEGQADAMKLVRELQRERDEQEKQMDEIIRQTLKRHGRCDDGRGGVFEFVDSDAEEKDELNSAIDASGNALY